MNRSDDMNQDSLLPFYSHLLSCQSVDQENLYVGPQCDPTRYLQMTSDVNYPNDTNLSIQPSKSASSTKHSNVLHETHSAASSSGYESQLRKSSSSEHWYSVQGIENDIELVNAVITIQSGWRMYLAKGRFKKRQLTFTLFGLRFYAAVTIQRYWRGYQTRRVLKEEATTLVFKYPVCLCRGSNNRTKRACGASIFDNDVVPVQVFNSFLQLEVAAFENWSRKAKLSDSDDHHSTATCPLSNPSKTPPKASSYSKKSRNIKSIVPLLRSKGPFHFYDGIIENQSHTYSWSHTYVRPNVPEECSFAENGTRLDISDKADEANDQSSTFLGHCMRRPKCMHCGRRLKELTYDVTGTTNQHGWRDNLGQAAPFWKTTNLQVSGTFDPLPWINFHQLSYCSLRRCLVYAVPKASLIPAHSASRHLVATASNATRSSGNNERLRAVYDNVIQELLDQMLRILLKRHEEQNLMRKKDSNYDISHDHEYREYHFDTKDKKINLPATMLSAGLTKRELKEYLEVYINHRFGHKSLIAIDFKFVNVQPALYAGDEPQLDWFLNRSEYMTVFDTNNNENNHVKLVV